MARRETPEASSPNARAVANANANANAKPTRFEDAYELLDEMSSGGFSLVHRARSRVDGQVRAVKVIRIRDEESVDEREDETGSERSDESGESSGTRFGSDEEDDDEDVSSVSSKNVVRQTEAEHAVTRGARGVRARARGGTFERGKGVRFLLRCAERVRGDGVVRG